MRIVKELLKKPLNANQLSEKLKMEYKNVRHHLKVLIDNRLVDDLKKKRYGNMYFMSETFKLNKSHFDEIWEKINKGGK